MLSSKSILIFFITLLHFLSISEPLEVLLPAQKVFRFAFSPRLFDWRGVEGRNGGNSPRGTLLSSNQRIDYFPSLQGKPDLPDWIHYTYSEAQNIGFIYGVPPENKSIYNLEVIARDITTNSLGIMRLTLNITDSEHFNSHGNKNVVHLKIDNLNDEDIFSKHRLQNLKSIFKNLLWPESKDDLHLIDVSSALKKGYRKPLNPSNKDGIILKLGSNANFSQELLNLDRETGPLRKKFRICPERDFHRTSVERHFRYEGFSLDWCAFRLMRLEIDSRRNHHYRTVGVMEEHDSRREINHMRSPIIKVEDDTYQGQLLIVPSRRDILETDSPSVYLTLLFGVFLTFIGMLTLIALLLCFNIGSTQSTEDVGLGNEGFIESFYLVLTDCFRCYNKDSQIDKQQNNNIVNNYQEELGTELQDPRSRRASSIQRQTDSLRRSALRKQQQSQQMSVSPTGTLDRYVTTEDEYQKACSSEREIFDGRPYPPPYFYESNTMSESKSYLV